MKDPTSPSPAKSFWRDDITGLRALAIIPVVLYHAFPSLMPGGYIGVDIFFVISGFLISGILFREIDQTSTLNLKSFYLKRIKRILPNLLVMLVFVVMVGYFFMTQPEYRRLGSELYSSAFFYQNFQLLDLATGYFSPVVEFDPLLHIWSLSIEEQFYIFFPLLLIILWKYRLSKFMAPIVGVGTALSFVGMLMVQNDAAYRFYFPLCRFWEIGVGICTSYALCKAQRYAAAQRFWASHQSIFSLKTCHAISTMGLVLVGIGLTLIDRQTLWPSAWTLLPVGGAALMIIAGPKAWVNKWLLSNKLLIGIGLISYSLYLWHWPFIAYKNLVLPQASWPITLLVVVVSIVVATLAYFGIEKPCLAMKTWRTQKRLLVGVCVSLVAMVATGQYLRLSHGVAGRPVNAEIQSVIQKDFIHPDEIGLEWHPHQPYPQVLLFGDSHVQHYATRVRELMKQYPKLTVAFITRAGTLQGPRGDLTQQHQIEQALASGRVKTVVISQIWGQYLKLDRPLDPTVFSDTLHWYETLVRQYPAIHFYFLMDIPWDKEKAFDIRWHLNRLATTQNIHDVRADAFTSNYWLEGNQAVMQAMQRFSNVTFIESASKVCPKWQCDLYKYHDAHHLDTAWVRTHATWIDPIFESANRALKGAAH